MQPNQKQSLIQKIAVLEDADLLAVLEEDISFFAGTSDITDSISPADLEELQQMAAEPFGFETESEDGFKKATERWRIG
jgi:hypothetical protein